MKVWWEDLVKLLEREKVTEMGKGEGKEVVKASIVY